MLNVGEKLWNGAIVTEYLAREYNAIQSRIDSFKREGRTVPVELINASHKVIATAF